MGGAEALTKLMRPRAAGCPHVLARWITRTAQSTGQYRSVRPGTYQIELRPPEQRGGRLVRVTDRCVFTPGHAGAHRTEDGRAWQ